MEGNAWPNGEFGHHWADVVRAYCELMPEVSPYLLPAEQRTCQYLLSSLLLSCLLTLGQSHAEPDTIPLRSSRWVTPVTLTSFATRHDPGVRLEEGRPCLVEAGTRLRKLVHNFGRRGFVLVQYHTPYKVRAGSCPNGTLLFLS